MFRPARPEEADPVSTPRLTEPEDRTLGVIEAIHAVRDQCPHAAVRENARAALETIQAGGAEELGKQAFFVLSTLAGWRGERADEVKHALQTFIDSQAKP